VNLLLPISFLRDFFEIVYYSILADYPVFGELSSIVLEPIFTFQTRDGSIISWRPIEKWNKYDFDISKTREYIKDSLENSASSDIEQVLYPLGEGVLGLFDNPLIYPGERLREFVESTLVRDPDASRKIDGICHFHPDGAMNLSDADQIAMINVARAMIKYNKEYVISLVIGRNDSFEYIERSKLSKSEFLEFILRERSNTLITAAVFHRDRSAESIDIHVV
jgi:hypothetical protein